MVTAIKIEGAVDIKRDSTFVRFCADRMVVTGIGSDLQISFLQIGSMQNSANFGEKSIEFEPTIECVEVACMRVGFAPYFDACMNFIRHGIEQDRVKGDDLAKQISSWAKKNKPASPTPRKHLK